MHSLNLQNFTSLFEILFAYNIGIAFSEKFRNFLGIHKSVERLIKNHREYQEVSKLIVAETDNNTEVKFTNLSNKFFNLQEKAKCYFINNRLELFLRPFYIYFGLMALFLLFYAGTLRIVIHESHLVFLNTLSTIILVICIIGSFFIKKIDWKAGPIRFFFGSLAIILITLCTGKEIINDMSFSTGKLQFCEYLGLHDLISQQIIVAVLIIFTPVITEAFQVFIFSWQLRRLKNKYDRYLRFYMPGLLALINEKTKDFEKADSVKISLDKISSN